MVLFQFVIPQPMNKQFYWIVKFFYLKTVYSPIDLISNLLNLWFGYIGKQIGLTLLYIPISKLSKVSKAMSCGKNQSCDLFQSKNEIVLDNTMKYHFLKISSPGWILTSLPWKFLLWTKLSLIYSILSISSI